MRSVSSRLGEDDVKGVIIDMGSYAIKGGFENHSFPTTIFRTRVGTQRYLPNAIFQGNILTEQFSSTNTEFLEPVLKFRHPVERGEVVNWDDFEKLLHNLFYDELRIEPEEHPVVLNKTSFSTKHQNEKQMQIMFETFNVPAFKHLDPLPSILAAEGRSTGAVLECGHDISVSGAVVEGNEVSSSVNVSLYGGRDVTCLLAKKLVSKRKSFAQTNEISIVRDIKANHGYVALDFRKENQKRNKPFDYILPDGNKVMIEKEPWEASESLFIPSATNIGAIGVIDLLQKSFENCDVDNKKKLYENILISGGSSCIRGFADKVGSEIKNVLPDDMKSIIHQSNSPTVDFWRGAAILASHPSFLQTYYGKDEYDEAGPVFIHRRRMF